MYMELEVGQAVQCTKTGHVIYATGKLCAPVLVVRELITIFDQ